VRHERVVSLLSDYLDGALSRRQAARVEAHLAECDPCRASLVSLERTVGLLRSLRGGVEAPELVASVMARVHAGEAEPSGVERLRTLVSRFIAGPLGAPLATAAVGLSLLAVLPRIEVEVSIPGRAVSVAPAAEVAERAAPQSRPRAPVASPPLLARRTSQQPSSYDPFACREATSPHACRDHHATMTRLAIRTVWEFMDRLESVPEPRREDWVRELSRFAAESGDAPGVAASLRATGDPFAQRMATRFEEAR
jgi:hypothetical protein